MTTIMLLLIEEEDLVLCHGGTIMPSMTFVIIAQLAKVSHNYYYCYCCLLWLLQFIIVCAALVLLLALCIRLHCVLLCLIRLFSFRIRLFKKITTLCFLKNKSVCRLVCFFKKKACRKGKSCQSLIAVRTRSNRWR